MPNPPSLTQGPPLVSIVVPSRTGDVEALKTQLARQSLRGWELLVDTDPSTPGKARNLGAARARGRWLVFFDDDVTLGSEKLLADLVKTLEAVGKNACVGVPCRITPWANRFQRQLYLEGFYPQRVSGVGGRDGPEAGNGSQGLLKTSWLDSVNGRCMAMGRETFQVLGGFDGLLPSGEEPELLYRLCRKGGEVFLLTKHWVYYAPPENFKAAFKKTIWYEQGNVRVAQKHPDAHYRTLLRNRWHAGWYLGLRSLSLLPLCFIKVSYQYRRPQLQWRPLSALLSYLGAWAYCVNWFAQSARAPDKKTDTC